LCPKLILHPNKTTKHYARMGCGVPEVFATFEDKTNKKEMPGAEAERT